MDVVKCPHCGKELPIEAKFCPYCMQRLDEPVAVKLPHEKKKSDVKAILISAAAVVAVLVLISGTVFYSRYKGDANRPDRNISDGADAKTNEISTSDVTHNDDTSLANSFINGQNENTANVPDNSGGYSVNGNTPVNTGSTAPNENNSREPDTTKTGSENSTAGTTANSPCADGHTWAPVTETVHHDEVGHYETVEHQRTVTKYKCPVCYEKFASLDLYYAHFDSAHAPSYDGDPIRALRNQYTTSNEIETYTTNEWVVDSVAYDETVVTGYKCSVCGKTK